MGAAPADAAKRHRTAAHQVGGAAVRRGLVGSDQKLISITHLHVCAHLRQLVLACSSVHVRAAITTFSLCCSVGEMTQALAAAH